MDLILWRHAEAEEGDPDLERKLTAAGIQCTVSPPTATENGPTQGE